MAQAELLASTDSEEYMPTSELRRYVQALLSEEVRGNKTEAERVSGVDKGRFYYAMYNDHRFRKWYSDQCDLYLGMGEGETSNQLMVKIRRGDVWAIRTFYELRSKLGSGTTVNVKAESRATVIQQLHSMAGRAPAAVVAASSTEPALLGTNGNGSNGHHVNGKVDATTPGETKPGTRLIVVE